MEVRRYAKGWRWRSTALDRPVCCRRRFRGRRGAHGLSMRSQRLYSSGGFGARAGGARSLGVTVSFILHGRGAEFSLRRSYYEFIASDQYVAEARFTVSGGLPPQVDGKLPR